MQTLTMKYRSKQLEIMDLGRQRGGYTLATQHDALRKLGLIHRLFGQRAAEQAFLNLPQPPTSILDVGCGGGAFTQRLGALFPQAKVVGLDIDSDTIAFARQELARHNARAKRPLPNVSFVCRRNPRLTEPDNSYDVVTATHVCHHLDDPTLQDFLQQAQRVARHHVILNDLHRSPIAYGFFWLVSPLFRNDVIRQDGLTSVARSFRAHDWHRVLHRANIPAHRTQVRWRWPFRWLVTLQTASTGTAS